MKQISIGKNVIKASIIVSLAKSLLKTIRYQRKRILNIYKDSQIFKKYKALSKIIVIVFTESFFGRISEVKEGYVSRAIIDNSKFIRSSLNMYKTCKSRFIKTETSLAVDLAKEIARKFQSSPMKIISIIAAIAILTNISLALLLHREIGLIRWIANILFLSMALAGLFCNARWLEIKQTSLILKKINKYCKK